ncbi:hypothetical protein PHYC_03542 [Phycisphaerales bacterium]|nr:hypothetical protein PHYC_03542 [Phycisphaerales bacterium]
MRSDTAGKRYSDTAWRSGGRWSGVAFAALVVALGACEGTPKASPTAISRPTETSVPAGVAEPADIVLSSEAWTFESKDGLLVRTPSYRVFTTATKYGLAQRVPVFLERCLIHYTSTLGDLPLPREPMETYMLGNRPQWTRVTQRFMGSEAEVYLKIQRGGFAADGRAILYDIGPRDTFAIAAHEGWHQYTQKTFRSPLPVSFEEGLATYMEGFRWADSERSRPRFLPWANLERFEQLRSANSMGKLMSLSKLQQATPQDLIADDPDAALVYYAQVWAMIHFLHEGEGGAHRANLEKLLRDAASGELHKRIRRELGSRSSSAYATRRTGVDLLGLYFGARADDMDAAYREFIADIVKVGSRDRIVAGESPAS